ncbi:MAG: protoheme IX farnesyltransferase [Bacteroidetes bacterium]|nr:protoheme IX farnesyltransferase [Bacteroidota bacterium]
MTHIKSIFKAIAALIKYKVSLAVTFTTVIGYLICSHGFHFEILTLMFSVFILAGGASALNEYQERAFDAKMTRTKNRPLPSGHISPKNALIISVVFISLGLIFLYFLFGFITAFLGFFNIIWYNLLYTKLKRITAFAVVPGSLTGAIPLLMGWTAAGAYVFDTAALFLAFFIFIWQIPHFWLLMFKYGKEYEAAGFPTINQNINSWSLKMIIFSWVLATSFSSVMAAFFIGNISIPFIIAIFVLNVLFIGIFVKLSFADAAELNLKKSFISINVYMFLFLLMLSIFQLLTS